MNSTILFACPICKSKLRDNCIAVEQVGKKKLGIQECNNCKFCYVWPRLDDPQGNYRTYTDEGWDRKYGPIERGEILHDRHNNYISESAYVKDRSGEGSIVLDVGCNAGWLLGYLESAGLVVEGVEPSPFLAKRVEDRLKVKVHNCFLHEVKNREGYYSAITATDVIEHINPEDIEEFISAMYKLLKPGGRVFIKTPNVSFTMAKAKVANLIPSRFKKYFLKGFDVWDAKEHVIQWHYDALCKIFEEQGFITEEIFVPEPIQTKGSPIFATVTRSALYALSKLRKKKNSVPWFAQDFFYIAKKQ